MESPIPLVSVVIPSARGGLYLREAIRSVQSQTYEAWELIVVMDGCDDDLEDVVGSDARITLIQQRRRGASIARNVALLEARGDLVALLDDDDRMLPARLDIQRKIFDDDDVVACHAQYRVIDAEGRCLRTGDSRDSTYRDFLGADSHILSGTAMFRRRAAWEVGGFNSLLTMGEGQDLLHRLMREGRVEFVPDVLYEYRVHSSNAWHGTARGTEETELTIRQHLLFAKGKGDVTTVMLARRGLATIPPLRMAKIFSGAQSARAQRRWVRAVAMVIWAYVNSPIATTRWIGRTLRQEHR